MKNLFLKDKNRILLIGFLLIGLASFASTFSGSSEPEQLILAPPPSTSVDTYIPRGYVLVPIELANAESLSSLVGDIGGVVDLYIAGNENKRGGLKVGSKLKLIRAPLNPQQYAVLVRDQDSSRILGQVGPFVAVVQNPEAKGLEIAGPEAKKVTIDYQN